MQRIRHGMAVALVGLAASASALAADGPSAPQSAVSLAQVTQLIVGLGIVLVVVAACAFALRRLPVIRSSRNATLKIVEAVPLGTRDRLLLVDAAGTRLLIGVTTGSIACLHVLGGGPRPASFGDALNESLTAGGAPAVARPAAGVPAAGGAS
ncbi:MAG: flagellar biosynthetic protein FliO [Gammaproteobacteria bacterium]